MMGAAANPPVPAMRPLRANERICSRLILNPAAAAASRSCESALRARPVKVSVENQRSASHQTIAKMGRMKKGSGVRIPLTVRYGTFPLYCEDHGPCVKNKSALMTMEKAKVVMSQECCCVDWLSGRSVIHPWSVI